MNTALPLLILIGRPAAGKSEVIRFLKELPDARRSDEFHIGPFTEIDDFPMIWAWFEEDAILARNGKPRLHTDDEGYFSDNFLWNVLIERLELDYWKLRKEGAESGRTAILEFARGTEHGGFRTAFSRLSRELLSQAAVLYIDVPYEESLRKNRRRFNPDKPHSILEHGLPDEKLERLYKGSDWAELSGSDPAYLPLNGVKVPYAVLRNEDDVTTGGGEPLARRLKETLDLLWSRWQKRPQKGMEGGSSGAASSDPERSGRTVSDGGNPPAAGSRRSADEADPTAEAGRPDTAHGRQSQFRIVAADESHFAAHRSELLIDREEVEAIIRGALSGSRRHGEVRTAVRHVRPVGYSGLRRVRLRDRTSFWAARPKRGILSHLVVAARGKTRWLCFWGSWVDEDTFRLDTFYPGRPAPREIHDPLISGRELKEAVAFWATHAIIVDRRPSEA
ncbi:hypothetical protein [Salinispira pacifica]